MGGWAKTYRELNLAFRVKYTFFQKQPQKERKKKKVEVYYCCGCFFLYSSGLPESLSHSCFSFLVWFPLIHGWHWSLRSILIIGISYNLWTVRCPQDEYVGRVLPSHYSVAFHLPVRAGRRWPPVTVPSPTVGAQVILRPSSWTLPLEASLLEQRDADQLSPSDGIQRPSLQTQSTAATKGKMTRGHFWQSSQAIFLKENGPAELAVATVFTPMGAQLITQAALRGEMRRWPLEFPLSPQRRMVRIRSKGAALVTSNNSYFFRGLFSQAQCTSEMSAGQPPSSAQWLLVTWVTQCLVPPFRKWGDF